MVDHHVDRPEVEAGQPVQLTGTNRSIDLIQGAASPRRTTARVQRQTSRRAHTPQDQTLPACLTSHHMTGGLPGLVAIARGQTPDPIPNSAVKTLCANGTAAQAAEE